ncbi:hypothetical protein BJV78DRAFT_196929 [Lactifluus subvellereus]|nr:hypothetical protein BJV78DRAFT_196929 [Lactifluus subvellereus]
MPGPFLYLRLEQTASPLPPLQYGQGVALQVINPFIHGSTFPKDHSGNSGINPLRGLRTLEPTLFKVPVLVQSSRPKSSIVDDRPKVCFRPLPSLLTNIFYCKPYESYDVDPSVECQQRRQKRVQSAYYGGRLEYVFDCLADLPTCMCGLRSMIHCHLPYPDQPAIGIISVSSPCHVYSRNKWRFDRLQTWSTAS